MGEYPPLELFKRCSRLLGSARLMHQDFRRTLAETSGHSYIYADPPYFTANERVFVEYGKRSFQERDLYELLDGLIQAGSRGAHVALTYTKALEEADLCSHKKCRRV
jgi:DNA adenine methylase